MSSIACVSDLESGTSATGKSNGKAEASKPAAESRNGTANGHRTGAANAELGDAEKASDEQQLPLDEMTEDGDETDSDD